MALQTAKIYGDFYSPERVLSYGRPWIFSVGSRSIGKSTGFGIWILQQYIKKKTRFIYVRRNEKELLSTCKNFFENAVSILNDFGTKIQVKYERKLYWASFDEGETWEECGTAIPLSMEQQYKSANLGEYGILLYDEFISRDPNKYLGNKASPLFEYDCCLSLYETVDRKKGESFQNQTIFIFTANNSSYYNPLFMGLGIDEYLRTDTKICAPKGVPWVVEQTTSVKATERMQESYAYQLSDKKNRDYAFSNIGFDQRMNFVEKIKKPMRPLFNVSYAGHKMGIYSIDDEGVIYVCNKTNSLITIGLTCGDQDKINYILAIRYHDSQYMITLRDCYYQGLVRFETNKCKYEIANFFLLTP